MEEKPPLLQVHTFHRIQGMKQLIQTVTINNTAMKWKERDPGKYLRTPGKQLSAALTQTD